MKKWLSFFFIIWLGLACRAQDSTHISRHSLSIAYFGEQITRPGVMIGYSYKALLSKNKRHALVTGILVGGYRWPFNTRGVFVIPHIGYKLSRPKGFQYDLQVGAGYLHTFADGTILEYTNGTFKEIPDKGVARGMLPYISTGIGWEFNNIGNSEIGIGPFLRAGIHGYYPINSLWSYRLHCSVGLQITLGKINTSKS